MTLDIDAYRETQIPAADDRAIVEVLESLYEFKNRAFFSSITEEAAKLYE